MKGALPKQISGEGWSLKLGDWWLSPDGEKGQVLQIERRKVRGLMGQPSTYVHYVFVRMERDDRLIRGMVEPLVRCWTRIGEGRLETYDE